MSEAVNADKIEVTDLVAELEWRGLLHQCTDREGLEKHLASGQRKIYAGFDPTADSLTIGNLVPIMMLAHVKRAGHTPIVVMGGGTGLIGDPSGKSAERTLMTEDTVQHHIDKQRPIFDNVLGQIEGPDYDIQNNADWLGKISYLEALRDIGKHFSVNMMMEKESVKARLDGREQGISYTEFSYMILQSYDFLHLYEHSQVTVQFGGSDQYGNIVAGSDLIRRSIAILVFEAQEIMMTLADRVGMIPKDTKIPLDLSDALRGGRGHVPSNMDLREQAIRWLGLYNKILEHWDTLGDEVPLDLLEVVQRHRNNLAHLQYEDAFGLTAPLVQKADGGKFGKTESGAVWLTAERTSPYAYYQFWLNASDEDAANWIKVFTFLSKSEVETLLAHHAEQPGARALQRTLAQVATRILHGVDAMEQAEAAGKALFSGDIASLDEQTLREVLADVSSSEKDRVDLRSGCDPLVLLVEVDLAKSKREAREFIAAGSVSINGDKLAPDTSLTEAHLLHGSLMAIRRGKKKWHLIRWS